MKKRLFILAVLIAATAILLCACSEELTPIQVLQQKYNEISAATEITQKIEIKQGELLQYDRNVTYTKTEEGYNAVGEEKRLNSSQSDSDDYLTVQEIDKQYTATSFVPSLTLNTDYFAADYRLEETKLSATVPNAHVKDVLQLPADVNAPTGDVKLEMNVSGERLQSISLSYVAGSSTVTITLTFTY